MRLFIALELPSALRHSLAARVEGWRPRLPPARWVPTANLHLTLRFLGETEPEAVPELGRLLAVCLGSAARFPLRLRGGGCFPPARPARVAWVAFEPEPALIALQAAVSAVVESHLGIAEGRAFHPHLTLARPRRPWPRTAVERWREALDGPLGPPFDVTEGHLMRSRLEAGGARHESLGVYPLARAGEDPV